MPLLHIVVILMVNVLWGTNFVITKIALNDIPPLLFAAGRFVIVVAILVPLLKPVRGEMRAVVMASLCMGVLHFTLMYLGLERADDIAGVAVASQLFVPFSTLLSIVFLGERIGWRRTLGISMAFSGVMYMSFDPSVIADFDALVMVSLAALSAAAGMIFMKRIKTASVFQMQAWVAAISAPLLAAASFVFESDHVTALTSAPPSIYAMWLFSALGAGLAGHGGMYWLLQRHDVSLISPTTLLATLVGIALGVVVLDEVLSRDVIIGGLLALVGILIVALRQPRRGPAAPATTPTVLPRSQRQRVRP